MDEPVHLYPEITPTKGFGAIEERIQQTVTIVKEMRQQEKVVQLRPRPVVRNLEDDWFVLLDVVPKKPGTILQQSGLV